MSHTKIVLFVTGFGVKPPYSIEKSVAITGLLESPNYCEEGKSPKTGLLGEFIRPVGRA